MNNITFKLNKDYDPQDPNYCNNQIICIDDKSFNLTIRREYFCNGSVAIYYPSNEQTNKLFNQFLEELENNNIKYTKKTGWSTSTQKFTELRFVLTISKLLNKLK